MEAVIRTAIFMRRPTGEGTTRETLRRECSMHPSERHRKIGFDGLDAHADAWNRTAAHAALVKTKAGAMISEPARQGGEWLLKQDAPLVTGADLIAVQEQLIRHGCVVAVYSHGNDVYSIVFVLNDFGHEKLHPSLARAKPYFEPFGRPAQLRIRGRDVYAYDDLVEPADLVPFEDLSHYPSSRRP